MLFAGVLLGTLGTIMVTVLLCMLHEAKQEGIEKKKDNVSKAIKCLEDYQTDGACKHLKDAHKYIVEESKEARRLADRMAPGYEKQ